MGEYLSCMLLFLHYLLRAPLGILCIVCSSFSDTGRGLSAPNGYIDTERQVARHGVHTSCGPNRDIALPLPTSPQLLQKLEATHSIMIQKEGIVAGLMSSLTLLYHAIASVLLYPVFSFLLVAMTLVLLVSGIWVGLKIWRTGFASRRVRYWLMILPFYLLVYADLFVVMYEKRKILILFLTLQKDIVLIIIASFLGLLIGKFFSKSTFEEEIIP